MDEPIFTQCPLLYEVKLSYQKLFMPVFREVKKGNATYSTTVVFTFSMN